jgi:uncharacterized protein YeaO (DUF488 family)
MNPDFILFTSYFSRFEKLVKRGEDNIFAHQGISIARSRPRNSIVEKCYPKLYPSGELLAHWLNNNISWGQYIEEYKAQLEELDPEEVMEDLIALDDSPILLCWENSDGLCHRHLVANWLECELGIRVREIL